MLHFTPLYKPYKGYMRQEKREGDIGVKPDLANVNDLMIQMAMA